MLTGGGMDATDGVQAIKRHGGVLIAQDPATARVSSMPSSAIRTGVVDQVLPLERIGEALVSLVTETPNGHQDGHSNDAAA